MHSSGKTAMLIPKLKISFKYMFFKYERIKYFFPTIRW